MTLLQYTIRQFITFVAAGIHIEGGRYIVLAEVISKTMYGETYT